MGIAMLLGRFMMILPIWRCGESGGEETEAPATGTFPVTDRCLRAADRRGGDCGGADIFPGVESGANSRTLVDAGG